MGRSVGDAAAQAVARSKKKEVVDRTPEQIIRDIRNNLSAKLAVTPDDVRFLLAQYDLAVALVKLQSTLVETGDIDKITERATVVKTNAEVILNAMEAEKFKVEYHVVVPQHVGDTVRIISEVGPVNVVGDVKETNAQKS